MKMPSVRIASGRPKSARARSKTPNASRFFASAIAELWRLERLYSDHATRTMLIGQLERRKVLERVHFWGRVEPTR